MVKVPVGKELWGTFYMGKTSKGALGCIQGTHTTMIMHSHPGSHAHVPHMELSSDHGTHEIIIERCEKPEN